MYGIEGLNAEGIVGVRREYATDLGVPAQSRRGQIVRLNGRSKGGLLAQTQNVPRVTGCNFVALPPNALNSPDASNSGNISVWILHLLIYPHIYRLLILYCTWVVVLGSTPNAVLSVPRTCTGIGGLGYTESSVGLKSGMKRNCPAVGRCKSPSGSSEGCGSGNPRNRGGRAGAASRSARIKPTWRWRGQSRPWTRRWRRAGSAASPLCRACGG